MIRCLNCEFFLSRQLMQSDQVMWDIYHTAFAEVPKEVVSALIQHGVCCKAFPSGIPAQSLSLDNSSKDWEALPCPNGYSYRPRSAFWNDEERRESDERLQRIIRAVADYTNVNPSMWTRRMFPWEHCAKTFQRMKSGPRRESISQYRESIYKCFYQDQVYLFGVGLPIPVLTDDLLENGEWYAYTWSD